MHEFLQGLNFFLQQGTIRDFDINWSKARRGEIVLGQCDDFVSKIFSFLDMRNDDKRRFIKAIERAERSGKLLNRRAAWLEEIRLLDDELCFLRRLITGLLCKQYEQKIFPGMVLEFRQGRNIVSADIQTRGFFFKLQNFDGVVFAFEY